MRSPTVLLKDAVQTFTANVKLFCLIYSVAFVVAIPLIVLLAGVETMSPTTALLLIPVCMVILIAVNVLMGIAMVQAVAHPTETTFKSAYSFAKKHFWPYLLVSVLYGAIIFLGFILLVIPGIIFMVWYSFSIFTLLFEGKKGMDALRASREYVRGKWMAVFGRFAFVFVVTIFVSFVFGLVFGFNEAQQKEIIPQIVSQLLNFVLVPIMMAYVYAMYTDLKGHVASSKTLEPSEPVQPLTPTGYTG